jgi:hypothetical protein
MGSIAVAAWVAKLAFIALLMGGIVSGELRPRAIAAFATLGALVWLGLPSIPRGADFVTSALAIIDIALVLSVYKGDIRIT